MTLLPFSDKVNDSIFTTGTFNVWEGSVRSSKTIASLLAFAIYTQESPDSTFLMTGATMGSVSRNCINGDFGFIALTGATQHTDTDGSKYLNYKGKVIYYAGADNVASYRKIRGLTIGGWYADEINLHHRDFIIEAMNRSLASRDRRMFWTLNPEAPTHWIYKEYIDRWENEAIKGYRYHHFTLDDNPAITAERKAEIAQQYSGVFYQRYILGLRVMAKGLIYAEFLEKDLTTEAGQPSDYGEVVVSCDYGVQNAMVYLMAGWHTSRGRWEVIKEWYYSGRENQAQLTDAEYYQHLQAFTEGWTVRDIIIDPSASSFIALVRKARLYRPVNAANAVVPGISYTASLMHIGKLFVSKDCTRLIEEIGGYVWDDKKAERTGKEEPIGIDDHACDALRYLCYTHIRRYERRYGILIGGNDGNIR